MRRSAFHILVWPVALAVALLAASLPAVAKELRIALSSEPTSLDPHFHAGQTNLALASHLFDRLIHTDEKQSLIPGLALTWTAVDPLTWEFKLRPGVTWHDGSAFTADDVVFSLTRALSVPNAPSGFGSYLRNKSVTKIDSHTVRIATTTPYPLLPNDMVTIPIVSHAHCKDATTADYNSGRAAIGTGPYRFAGYVPGERFEFVSNPDYWGPKPAWDKIVLRTIRSGPARVAALLAGETDVIEDVPNVDVARLKTDGRVSVAQSPSFRVLFLQADQWRETTPFVNAKDGSAIKNPFRNVRVRRAISHAINREALVARIMEGNAQVAAQFLPEGFFGVSPAVKPATFDLEKSKRLLAEAGLPNGFKVTLHGPAGRYPNDSRLLEAVAMMLTRSGIEATIETMPSAQFFTRASTGADGQPEFSLFLAGWGAVTGENSSPLKALLATYDAERGLGTSNRGRYSNKVFDETLDGALSTIELDQVKAGLAKATEIALADAAIIPLLHPLNTWAVRKGLTFRPRTDEATTAMSVSEE